MSDLTSSRNLLSLLQIENDHELITITCPSTGVLVWPLIRVPMMRTVISDWLYKSEALTSSGSRNSILKLAKNTIISSIHNMSCNVKINKKILIQSTGLGNYWSNGWVDDRLVGHFSNALPEQTLVYQDKAKDHIIDKYKFGSVFNKLPRNVINKLYSKLAMKTRHRNLALRVINRVAENAAVKLGYEFSGDRIQILSDTLASHLTILPYASETYANWFSKSGFKLLLQEESCYGGSAISIIHAARMCGMVVAEYQHGAISKGHDAYNVAEALATSHSFKAVLPDYLLTYGKWWSSQINMPVEKVAIGNPHLSEVLGSLESGSHSSKQILILGDGIETKLYLNLAEKVHEIVKRHGLQVVFRPHPLECDNVKMLVLPEGVQLDRNPEIYSSLKASNVVISELSTGLFEAVGLVDKVLIWETDKSRFAFPEMPFKSFSTMDELESLLTDKNSFQNGRHVVPATELWEPNWSHNYLHFVERVVGQRHLQ